MYDSGTTEFRKVYIYRSIVVLFEASSQECRFESKPPIQRKVG